jgi:hypothetical protein
MADSEFLYKDATAGVYTSARKGADGKPITDVQLTGSNVGYSTDTKPTTGVKKGDTFLELDTKDVYIYDGALWVVF